MLFTGDRDHSAGTMIYTNTKKNLRIVQYLFADSVALRGLYAELRRR